MLPAICLENTTKETWETRREELVELFRKYEFGRRPEIP